MKSGALCAIVKDGKTTIKIKFASSREFGMGGREDNCPKGFKVWHGGQRG